MDAAVVWRGEVQMITGLDLIRGSPRGGEVQVEVGGVGSLLRLISFHYTVLIASCQVSTITGSSGSHLFCCLKPPWLNRLLFSREGEAW